MICSWCRIHYEGNPLYHVCADGTTFDIRRERTQKEFDEEYARQDRVKSAYKNRRRTDAQEDGIVMNWTPYDIDFLIGLRIKL